MLRTKDDSKINQNGAVGYKRDPNDNSRDTGKPTTPLLIKFYLG